MLKKIVLPVVALFMALALTSAPAKAGVRFGVTIAPPVYSYPAYPYDPYAYSYVPPDPGYYAPYWSPTYVYPYNYGGGFYYGGHGWDRGGHEFRGYDRGHEGFRGGAQGRVRGGSHGGHRR